MKVWIVQAKRSKTVYGVFFNEEDAKKYCYDNEGFRIIRHKVRGSKKMQSSDVTEDTK